MEHGKLAERITDISYLSTRKVVWAEPDTTVNGKATGEFVYYQDSGRYTVQGKGFAYSLRQMGFTVSNQYL
jgi:hypothetical protein